MTTASKEQSLHVLFVSHSGAKGGAERAMLEVIDGFLAKGIVCTVVLPCEGALKKELEKRSVEIRIAPFFWWAGKEEKIVRDENIFLRQVVHLAQIVKNCKPDI